MADWKDDPVADDWKADPVVEAPAKKPGHKAETSPLPAPWFRGYDYANPMSDEEISRGGKLWRGIAADAAMAPSQMVSGLADVGGELANRAGLPLSNSSRMSEQVSTLRNLLAGREGTGAGPLTGITQGLVTAPFSPMTQAIGLGAGLAGPNESPAVEGGKAAATSLIMKLLAGTIAHRKPESLAQQNINKVAVDEDVPMLMGTQHGQPLMKEVERRAERNVLLGGIGNTNIATRTREKIDDKFAEALWRHTGQRGSATLANGSKIKFNEFTPEHFEYASKNIGEKLAAPFKDKYIPFRGFSLDATVANAESKARQMSDPAPVNKAIALIKNKLKLGRIDSSEMNVIMDDLRGLADKSYDDKNKVAADAIREISKAVRANAISNIPTQSGKEAYKTALVEWANLKTIEDVFKRSADNARGNIDPSKLKDAVIRSMGDEGFTRGRADLSNLALLGQAMRGGSVLPEGVKINPLDAAIYMSFNNPMSMYLRKNNPIEYEPASAMLRALGIQMNTP